MTGFFFACNFYDEMYTSVHESKCFDLDFAEKNDWILSVATISNLNFDSVRKQITQNKSFLPPPKIK